MKSVFKNRYFWILFLAASIISAVAVKKFFPLAFPLVNIDLKMNRSQALAQADELAQKYGWLPATHHQVATFQTDCTAQTFVELAAGGVQAFTAMMNNNLYMPYYWEVRHYYEHDKHETIVRFTPSGTPYGFQQIMAENDPGADLSQEQALAIAQDGCKEWNIDLSPYTLIEQSKEVSPSKRSDHTFVYQRTNEKIGDGFYRLRLEVSGDKLTEIMHFIKIPESFLLHYKELRSSNNSIATAATMAMILLYILGGLITFLLFVKINNVLSYGFIAAFIIAFLELLSQLSKLPVIWNYYNTAVAPTSFLISSLISILFSFVIRIGMYAFVFSVAEALTRKAFGSQIQLWKLWDRSAASSWQVWGRTIGGYLIVPLDLIFAMSVYIIAQKYFGWWIPAGTLTDPNILAEYAPWLSAFSSSLTAGFLEECLFRAIPLASAALWGERFGKKKLFIVAAFVIQIIIFGAAHANYPTLPAYARLIELIVPSTVFGGLYLAFGLLPAIISHVIFDVFWFALPLFISHASGAWVNQLLVIMLSIIPLLVIIYARLRTGSWHALAESFYNKAHKPVAKKAHTIAEEIQTIIHKKISLPLIALSCIGAFAIGATFFIEKNQAPSLMISRTGAIAKAREILEQQNIHLESPWQALTTMHIPLNTSPAEQNYIWQKARDLYTPFLNSYLRPPLWVVRFVRFAGTPSERAEEYWVVLADAGTLIRTMHILPEDAPGKTISKEEARALATQALKTSYNLYGTAIKEISAQETVLPARKDWLFILLTFHIRH